MNLYQGDKKILYCDFKVDGKIVQVENPQVRILHEFEDNVYEDLPWQTMTPMDEGYVYNFDTNVCQTDGKYVIVYKAQYQGETLNQLEEFNIIPNNLEGNNTIYIYGFVNDINNNHLIKNVKIKVVDCENGSTIYQTTTDEDGKWEVYIPPSDYEFKFELDGYNERSVRVQIGDENKEIQFNNISLEKQSDCALGNGLYKIEEEFTTKNDMGIPNVEIEIFSSENVNECLVSTRTDDKGKWKAFLDDGSYLLKIQLPSGVKKKFQLTVYNDGSKTIDEIVSRESTIIHKQVDNGHGDCPLTDYVLDAHGNGIENVLVRAFAYNIDTDSYELECQATTTSEGQFELNLNHGKYKLVVQGEGFKRVEQTINV